MFNTRLILPVFLLLLVSADKGEKITIGFAASTMSEETAVVYEGFRSRAEQKGWRVILTNAKGSSAVQRSQVAYLASLGVQAVVAVPVDGEALGKAGVPIYAVEAPPPDCTVDLSVSGNHFLAGKQCGSAMVKLLEKKHGKPKGIVFELEGDMNERTKQVRSEGFHFIVDPHPEIEVITRHTTELSEGAAIDGFFVLSDTLGVPAVLQILKKMNKKIPRDAEGHLFVVGIGGSDGALQGIRDGFVDHISSIPFSDYGILTEWIEKGVNREAVEETTILDEEAPWSPAHVIETGTGHHLKLSPVSVTPTSVDDPDLWGNR